MPPFSLLLGFIVRTAPGGLPRGWQPVSARTHMGAFSDLSARIGTSGRKTVFPGQSLAPGRLGGVCLGALGTLGQISGGPLLGPSCPGLSPVGLRPSPWATRPCVRALPPLRAELRRTRPSGAPGWFRAGRPCPGRRVPAAVHPEDGPGAGGSEGQEQRHAPLPASHGPCLSPCGGTGERLPTAPDRRAVFI